MGILTIWIISGLLIALGVLLIVVGVKGDYKQNDRLGDMIIGAIILFACATALIFVNSTVFRKWDPELRRVNYEEFEEDIRTARGYVIDYARNGQKEYTIFDVDGQSFATYGHWEKRDKGYIVFIGDNNTKKNIADDQIRDVVE